MFPVAVFAITVLLMKTLEITANESKLPPPPRPEDIVWPKNCTNYCTDRPANYPQKNFDEILKNVNLSMEYDNSIEDRINEVDVAGCKPVHKYKKIYLIKDEDDLPRFVATTINTKFMVHIEECYRPGLVTKAPFLDQEKLLNKPFVHCYEVRVPILFPVLSLDGQTIESVAPKGGISVSCSAKIKH